MWFVDKVVRLELEDSLSSCEMWMERKSRVQEEDKLRVYIADAGLKKRCHRLLVPPVGECTTVQLPLDCGCSFQ